MIPNVEEDSFVGLVGLHAIYNRSDSPVLKRH
jgi:hypothetical protein